MNREKVDKKFYTDMPRKRAGSGALFFNKKGELLLLKPNYKSYWTIPGGIVEKDESPLETCRREVKEEINLDIAIKNLLCVDYLHNPGNPKGESFKFIFHGGRLGEGEIRSIKLQKEEIDEFRFCSFKIALSLLESKAAKRVIQCLKALKDDRVLYLEDGVKA